MSLLSNEHLTTKRNKGTTCFRAGGRKNESDDSGLRTLELPVEGHHFLKSFNFFTGTPPKKIVVHFFSPKAAEKLPSHGMTARTKLNPNAQHGTRCTGVAQLTEIIFLR